MAGTLTITRAVVASGIQKLTCAWTSTAGGAVSANPADFPMGTIFQVKFVPGAGGVQPSNNYTVALNDTDGADVLNGIGGGTNLSNAASKYAVGYFGVSATQLYSPFFNDASQQLDMVVAAAGNAKQGTVIVWMRIGAG